MFLRRYCREVVLAAFLFIHSPPGKTENRLPLFYHYTIEEGLSYNTVNHIGQDYKGFIWISTDNGLDKFDGYTFTIYHKSLKADDLSSDRISRTFQDSDSVLWVCTARGLDIYNREKDNFIRVNLPGIDVSMGESNIVDMAEDKKGSIWILTVSDLIHYDRSENKYQNIKIPSNYPAETFTKLFVDTDSTLWLGVTGKGIMIYNFLTGKYSYKYSNKFPAGVKQFVKDKVGNRYIAANEGVLGIIGKSGKKLWHPFVPSRTNTRFYEAWDMMIDHSGRLWIATDNSGVQIANKNLKITTSIVNQPGDSYSLASNIIRCIFEDKDDNIWIGTLNTGLLFMPSRHSRYFTPYIPYCPTPTGQGVKTITSVCEAPSGTVWLGSDGSGLFRYDPKTGVYFNYQYIQGNEHSITANSILDILSLNTHNLLLATYNGGFGEFNITKGSFERLPLLNSATHQSVLSVRNFIFDKKGNLWIATHKDGLIKYDLKKQKVLKQYLHKPDDPSSLTDNYCLKVMEDHEGNLWVATYYGLSRLNPSSGVFTNYHYNAKDTNSLSNDWVYTLCVDKHDRIWVGTLDGLCLYLPKTDNFRRYVLDDSKKINTINGILADTSNKLWISTNKGIFVFNPRTGKSYSFSKDDGLPGNTFLHGSYQKGPSGKLYFGATFGAVSFSPDKLTIDTVAPVVVLTKLILDYKPVNVRSDQNPHSQLEKNISLVKEIRIPFHYKEIGFEFVGINYVAPHSTRYAYMLEGFDSKWNYIGKETKVSFTNLGPGKYTLKIKASNKFGYWNKKIRSVDLIVIPPWWRTLGFYFLSGLFLIGFVIFIILFREKNLRKYSKQLESHVKERTIEITKQNEEIKRQSREILVQKQHIEYQRSQLEEKNVILEEQAKELKAANERLTESNATKDRFFSIIAHDLKNPLGTLLGFVELIEEQYDNIDDQRKKNLLKLIVASSKNVYNLLENLLHWSRAQQGIIEYNPKFISVKKLIEDTVDLFIPNFQAKNISYQIEIRQEDARIYADENLTGTILRNLISNATKFTRKDGRVTIMSNEEDGRVEICVKDTGVGISKDNLDKLFSIDRHITTPGTGDEAGTGLGLILSKEFIEKQKGTIHVESQQGNGTTFCISLPTKKANKKTNPD